MTQDHQQRQAALPASIPLFRYSPPRRPFDFDAFEPARVTTASDLPPYLVLGSLDESSFCNSAAGWSATWRGSEADTFLQLDYLTAMDHYRIQQKWCGVDGAYSMASARLSLAKAIARVAYLQFPVAWDRAAKESLERSFQLHYVEPLPHQVIYFGIPDGALRTIAIPVAVPNLRSFRTWLANVADAGPLRYPISAEAKLVLQAVNYVEGKAPEWTRSPSIVLEQSITDIGTPPLGLPVRETAPDGTAAWTVRRSLYLAFLTVPFAGLKDLLTKLASPDGPIRGAVDPSLRGELQPLILPAGFEVQCTSINVWDAGRTTRSTLQFADPYGRASGASAEPTETLLLEAERISGEVAAAIRRTLGDAVTSATAPEQPKAAPPEKTKRRRSAAPQPLLDDSILDPLEQLRALADLQDRIDVIAADLMLPAGSRRFDGIDDWDLACALDIDLTDTSSMSQALWRTSLEDFSEEFPAWNRLRLLQDEVSSDRYSKLERQGQQIAAGTRDKDIAITKKERKAIEDAIARKRMDDGAGWLILRHSQRGRNQKEVCFEVLQGDGGELFDLTGPYEIHDEGWPEHEDWVVQ